MFVRMLRRSRHHHGHERVSLQDETADGTSDGVIQESQDVESGSNGDALNPASADNESGQTAPTDGTANENTSQEFDADEPSTITIHPHPTTHPFLTSQISVERQIRQRRQGTCTLLLLFLVMRLWVEAIIQKDVGLLFLSTMGTTWTYRYWASHRQDEEYDRQIEENPRSSANNSQGGSEERNSDAASSFDPDLGLMSFQAQLALAILESQRQMFENGGYGGNDSHHDGPGVTEEAKAKWKRYEWGGEGCSEIKRFASNNSIEMLGQSLGSCGSVDGNNINYGSVGSNEDDEDQSLETSPSKLEEGLVLSVDKEEPSCSICLCEYEMGEPVMRLPCNHIYHESCLDSWVSNHVRCPLCNYDLMEGFEPAPRPAQQQQQQNNNQELFRRMMGVRRASRSTRRQLATMLAAMEDNVV